MVEIIYLESEGQVFESRCAKKEFCPRCFRLFKRNLEKAMIDLTQPQSTPEKQIIVIE